MRASRGAYYIMLTIGLDAAPMSRHNRALLPPAASSLHGGPGMNQSANLQIDQDLKKGAVEDGPNTNGNSNAQAALDESGLPLDDVAIAEDVLGANEDETQG
jgi:hypothetical protein